MNVLNQSSTVLDKIYATRRANLKSLTIPPASSASLCEKLDFTPQYLSQLIGMNHSRTVSEKAARTIEEKLGLANGWLDVAR